MRREPSAVARLDSSRASRRSLDSSDAGVSALLQGPEPSPGSLLCGRYRLESPIAQGATALVYRAVDELLDDVVAVKLVLHDGLFATREAQAIHLGLREEALLAMRLSHPNILRVFTYERQGPWEFMVMELVAGQDLFEGQNRQPGGRYPLRETLQIGIACLDALAHAHALGVVHNDVKPRNLLMTCAGTIKLCDFGLAGLAAVPALTSRRPEPIIGTPAYMAPERIRGEPPDARSDLYSLAATLWALATGRTLFGADDAALARHVHSPVPDSSILPPAVADVLRTALAKRPSDRFPSAHAMRDALLRSLADLSLADGTDDFEVSIDLGPELGATDVRRASVADRANMVPIEACWIRSAYGGKFSVPAFLLDRTPTTNADYSHYLMATGAPAPAHWLGDRMPAGKDNHPVVGVTIDEARSYAAWAGKRLPTSLQWEAAAQGGARATAFPWGDVWDPKRAVCRERGCTETAPVGLAEGASPEGVLDLIGNIWEWTESDGRCPPEPERAWVMGGSFRHACNEDGHIARTAVSVGNAYEYLGFRCALEDGET